MKILPKYPVYIPSKGRADRCLTAQFLERDGVPFYLVVEPQDAQAYAERYGEERIITLPENDPGSVVYARNFISEIADGERYHWQIDDNIKNLLRQKGARRVVADSGYALATVEEFIDRYDNIAAASLRNKAFAWDAKDPFYLNQMVYCCMLVKTDLPYTWRVGGGEDVDMSLQVLSGGWCTVVTNIFQIDKVSSGSMPGGHKGLYDGGGRLERARELKRLWPGAIEIDRKWDRAVHRVKTGVWRSFPQRPRLRDEATT